MVPIEVVGVQIEPHAGTPLVLLRELAGARRVLPVFIGGGEALSIAMGLQGLTAERPLTHDLLVDVLASMNATVQGVSITEVRDGTFYAELSLGGPRGAHVLTSRPSDAIALAVRVGAPLFVDEGVMDAAAVVPDVAEDGPDDGAAVAEEADEGLIEQFRAFLASADPADFGSE